MSVSTCLRVSCSATICKTGFLCSTNTLRNIQTGCQRWLNPLSSANQLRARQLQTSCQQNTPARWSEKPTVNGEPAGIKVQKYEGFRDPGVTSKRGQNYYPSAIKRMNKHGLEKRLATRKGKEMIWRRLLRGRWSVST